MTVIHILIGIFNFFLYRNVLFMKWNMTHMLPTVHIIKLGLCLGWKRQCICCVTTGGGREGGEGG